MNTDVPKMRCGLVFEAVRRKAHNLHQTDILLLIIYNTTLHMSTDYDNLVLENNKIPPFNC